MSKTEAPALRVDGLSKTFGRARVLRDVSLEIAGGEFIGLVGPNGAGKSTLIKVLDGLYRPTTGRILVDGREVPSLGGLDEVAFIHQDLGLIDELTISDNMRLGQRALRLLGPIVDRGAERAAAAEGLAAIGLDIDVATRVGELSPGEKTLVAIARAFARGATILFVDEATSTLTGPDALRVIDTLRRSADAGATVIMVSHRLSEILHATRRVVMLLDGELAADQPTTGMGRRELVDLLAAHERSKEVVRSVETTPKPSVDATGRVVLTLDAAKGGRAGPISMIVKAGEVVGLTGTPGSGLHDVGFLAHGSLRPESGRRDLVDHGTTALVPPHRETEGGFDSLAVISNLTMSSLSRWRTALGFMRSRAERDQSTRMTRDLDVRPAGIDHTFANLSGGNKQKVIFGRALLRRPDLYVLCEPTRGVDLAARHDIYDLIRTLPDENTAVLVVSSDPEDLFAVCDRVSVVEDGVLSDFREVAQLNAHELEALI